MMATQKEWELETRIKYLEGTGLQFLYEEYCGKIDQIFQTADKQLEEVKEATKAEPKPIHSDEDHAPPYRLIALDQYMGITNLSMQSLQQGFASLRGEANLARAGSAARGAFGSIF